MSNSQLPVLIVGAGPTGLTMACELARRGIPFRIIDKKTAPTLASNATWVQTRTLELLDLMGIAPQFLKAGHPCSAINLYSAGKRLASIPLTGIDSTYPYILMVPQSETERLLQEHLATFHHNVEYAIELIDIKQENDIVIATLRLANGKEETLRSDWLIGCDGINSFVREKCNIHFSGEDLNEQFIVADAYIDSFTSKNEIHVFCDQGTLFAASPLGDNKYRITANMHIDHPRKLFYPQEVIDLVQDRGHGEYYVKDVTWISPFWIHGKVAKQLRHGSIFLAGDAAHVHSPAGGQGMNAGMQDAFNLAWKLALSIKREAKDILLSSYQDERYPVVSEIVNQTEAFTKIALDDKAFLSKLQDFSDKVSHGDKALIAKISEMISQVSIRYTKSPIIDNTIFTSEKSPLPGERAPDVILSDKRHFYAYMRDTFHHIFIFAGSEDIAKSQALMQELEQFHPDLIKTHLVSKQPQMTINNAIIDANDALHQRYHIDKPTVIIIRPDNYIAYRCETLSMPDIQRFLEKYLI